MQPREKDGRWHVEISDKFHYIPAVLLPECVKDLAEANPNLTIPQLRGGLLELVQYKVIADVASVSMVVRKLRHIGAEAQYTIGDPQPVTEHAALRAALLRMRLYGCDEYHLLYLHISRSTSEVQVDWPMAV